MKTNEQTANNKPVLAGDGFPAWELEGSHSGALLDLMRLMRGQAGFSLIFLQYNDPLYRDKLIPYLNRYAANPVTLRLDPEMEYSEFEKRLFDESAGHDLIQVVGLSEWLAGESRGAKLRGFNYHRELLAERVRAALALWMTENDIRDFALEAPDMWAWRQGVIDFSVVRQEQSELERSRLNLWSADLVERQRRMEEIELYLAGHPEESISRANLLRELGQIRRDLGRFDDAMEAFTSARAIYRRNDYKREHAFVIGDIARVYVDKGDVDQALKLHQERLEVFERLGDIGEMAHTLWSMGQIDIMIKDHKSALQRLTRSYDILLKLGRLDGICSVGLDYGRLLCSMGENERGVEILRRSEEGFLRLGREDLADQVKKAIDSQPARRTKKRRK